VGSTNSESKAVTFFLLVIMGVALAISVMFCTSIQLEWGFNIGPISDQSTQRYTNLQCTFECGILYGRGEEDFRLLGCINTKWAGLASDGKSTAGYVFALGTCVVSWLSKKQHAIALPPFEVGYRVEVDYNL
jgi:hypothetical protein